MNIILGIILGAAITANSPVQIKWKPQYADSPNATWFETQKSCDGISCCGPADAEPYFDGYDQNADGSVTLGNGTRIDACKVLRGPNPTGHALWWKAGETTYCFSPGPGL